MISVDIISKSVIIKLSKGGRRRAADSRGVTKKPLDRAGSVARVIFYL